MWASGRPSAARHSTLAIGKFPVPAIESFPGVIASTWNRTGVPGRILSSCTTCCMIEPA